MSISDFVNEYKFCFVWPYYCTIQILSKHTTPQLRIILIKDKLFGPMVSDIWDKEAFIDTIRNTSSMCAAYSSYQIVVGGQ